MSEEVKPPSRVWLRNTERDGHRTWIEASGTDEGEHEYTLVDPRRESELADLRALNEQLVGTLSTRARREAEMIAGLEAEFRAEIARSAEAVKQLVEALRAITMIAGNLPDETLETCGGIHEGRGRALMVSCARTIARAALVAYEATLTTGGE
jgi:hypothetical protein